MNSALPDVGTVFHLIDREEACPVGNVASQIVTFRQKIAKQLTVQHKSSFETSSMIIRMTLIIAELNGYLPFVSPPPPFIACGLVLCLVATV